jgi:hypothetical protein
MRENNLDLTPFDNVIKSGFNLLLNLFFLINNLISLLRQQLVKIDISDDRRNKNMTSEIGVKSLKYSIILLQFCFLEALCNFLADLIVRSTEGLKGSPHYVQKLTQIEVDFLKENKTIFDPNTGRLKGRKQINSTLDKITAIPFLLGKLYGKNFRLNKKDQGWNKLLELKKKRDELTHPKLGLTSLIENKKIEEILIKLSDTNIIHTDLEIRNENLFDGIVAIRWYLQEMKKLFRIIYSSKEYEHINRLNEFFYITLALLRHECTITDKEFENKYPSPSPQINFRIL